MIKSQDCKKAIVEYLKERPGFVALQFADNGDEGVSDSDFEAPSLKVANWKRLAKDLVGFRIVERTFDCTLYDDQLRAYTRDDGDKILSVVVQGE